MAVAITINSLYRDNGVKAAERAMKRLERIARDSGNTLSDADRKRAQSIEKWMNVGSQFQSVGTKMQSVGRGMSKYITAPVVLGSGIAVKSFKEFDDALGQSYAIMGKLDQQTKDKMASVARTVATTTRTSHTEAAMSYYYLASAGLDAQQSIAALPQVAKFAQAGMFSMEEATSLAADAQSSLGLKSKDAQKNLENMTRVTDVLTRANIVANGSVEEFAIAMTTKAGAALKTSHKSIEEGTAVLAALADQGVKGANAGEALNQFLRDIPRAATINAKAFKHFGISVFDSNGNLKNSADIMQQFEKRMGKMSDSSKAAAFQQMGLNRGVQGVIKMLLGSSDAIRKYEQEMKNASGLTAEVANKQLESAQGKFEIAKNKMVDAAIVAAPTIMKAVTPALKSVTDLAEAFSKLDPNVQQFVVKAALVGAVAGPALIGLGKMTHGVGTLIINIQKFRAARLAASVAETGKAATEAGTAMAGASTAASGFGAAMAGVVIPVAAVSAVLIEAAYASKKFGEMLEAQAQARDAADAADFYASAEGRVITASRVAEQAKKANASATDQVKNAEQQAANASLDLEGAILAQERAHKNTVDAKKQYGKKSLEYREALHYEKQAHQQLKEAKEKDKAADVQQTAARVNLMNSYKHTGQAVVAFGKAQDNLRDKMNKTGSTAGTAGKKVGKQFAAGLHTGTAAASSSAKSIKSTTKAGLAMAGPASSAGKNAGKNFAKGVGSGKSSASTSAKSVASSASAGFRTHSQDSYNSGHNVGAGFARGISSAVNWVSEAAKGLVSRALGAINKKAKINSPARLFYAPGKYISLGLAHGLKSGQKNVQNAAEKMVSKAYDRIQEINDRNKNRVARGVELAGTWGLFDTPDGSTERTVTTSRTLSVGSWGSMTTSQKINPLEAARLQTQTLRDWDKNISIIAAKGASASVIKALREAGPSNYADVNALSGLSSAQVKEYSNLYAQRQSLGKTFAEKELGKQEKTSVVFKEGSFKFTINNAKNMSEEKLAKEVMKQINLALKKKKKAKK